MSRPSGVSIVLTRRWKRWLMAVNTALASIGARKASRA